MIEALVHEHGAWLSGFLRGLTRREVDAEDAYQEVWVRVIKAGGVREGASPRAFLSSIARSVIVDRFRREKRFELTMDGPDESGVPLAPTLIDSGETPAERHQRSSTREEVLAAIRELPEGPRNVVLLRIEAELSFKEIAAELGVPLGTALTWMRSATERLKEKLGGSR